MHFEYMGLCWNGRQTSLKTTRQLGVGVRLPSGLPIMIIEDEVLRKRQEIERYKEILARYESGRWLNYGKARLSEKIQELKILEESLAPIV